VLGCVLLPSLFYDQWIWKYYWGPVVADAHGHPVSWKGIYAREGYTFVSEITYGIILIFAVYGLYKLLRRLNISIDWNFCLALMPLIIYGPVTRVLEDAGYFKEPFVYWFISPLIYVQTAIIAIFFLLIGCFLRRKIPLIFLLINVCYTLIWFFGIDYGKYILNPLIVYILSFFAFLPILFKNYIPTKKEETLIIFSGGLLFLLPPLYLLIIMEKSQVRFDVLAQVLILIVLILFSIFFISNKFKSIKGIYREPFNLSLIAGHTIDGLTSYISIYDPFNVGLPGYEEKHPASNILMEMWPPLFPIVKLVLIILIIYILHKYIKGESNLINLLKICILVLGLSPGLRDLLRVTISV
jgi:uncharacterized membrane protein